MATREVDRLLRHYHQAPPEIRENGAVWYRASRGAARRIARETGVSYSKAAGVIAALSPMNQWANNVAQARAMCAGETVKGLGNSIRCAQRIIDGERPTDVLKGRKVNAFYRAIMGDESAAVIDRWMMVAMGHEHIAPRGKQEYERLSDCLSKAAAKVGIGTATFQAIVWTQVRGGWS